ncbi:hypothetical protein JZ751_018062 [Albula glossodonta]|uniref:Uncharacterized protein n=1 Tax=Albula glossodonta TaxID=121402 RepID=A0A8T2PQ41_9TELE|nr:hypothetical protein JZ751_018062 [Albula glossodonta]
MCQQRSPSHNQARIRCSGRASSSAEAPPTAVTTSLRPPQTLPQVDRSMGPARQTGNSGTKR